jgi:hypothetical protein
MIAVHKHDGNMVTPYRLRPGDTLSHVAVRFHFKSWVPLWNYNTRVRPILGDDPDKIPAGTTIFIPRSQLGYDRLMAKYKSLELQMKAFGDQETYSREADFYRLQASNVMIDFAGDVATVLVSIGGQAIRAAEAAKLAGTLKGSERVAADYLASREAERLAETIRDTAIDKAKDATKDWAVSKTSDTFQDKYGKSIDKGATATTKTIPKAFKAIAGYSMLGGKALLDVADIVLDYIKPSELADHWVAFQMGTTTAEETRKQNAEQIRHTVAAACAKLHEKMAALAKEKKLVYGTALAATAVQAGDRL